MKTVPGRFNKTKKFQRRYFSYHRTNAKIGLAQASKIYRQVKGIPNKSNFSVEGMKLLGELLETQVPLRDCFETINAAGVLQVPLVISVWDDDYGISVHAKHQ
jgi:hypothetical protein